VECARCWRAVAGGGGMIERLLIICVNDVLNMYEDRSRMVLIASLCWSWNCKGGQVLRVVL
jgi:hypothetical protein